MVGVQEMRERPILFSSEMVRAILDGRKTQTRRVIKFRSLPEIPVTSMYEHGGFEGEPFTQSWSADHAGEKSIVVEQGIKCPYGQPGDRLWVREAFHSWHEDGNHAIYRADGEDQRVGKRHESYGVGRWSPSIHMPRWASRITLEVTGVRVERVQKISAKDLVAEGAITKDPFNVTNRPHFQRLWDWINTKRGFGWEKNPWVWVVEFKRI